MVWCCQEPPLTFPCCCSMLLLFVQQRHFYYVCMCSTTTFYNMKFTTILVLQPGLRPFGITLAWINGQRRHTHTGFLWKKPIGHIDLFFHNWSVRGTHTHSTRTMRLRHAVRRACHAALQCRDTTSLLPASPPHPHRAQTLKTHAARADLTRNVLSLSLARRTFKYLY